MLGPNPEPVGEDDSIVRMRAMPTTVVSSTLQGPFDWPNATVTGDGRTEELTYRPTIH
jgi:hypothetical protein